MLNAEKYKDKIKTLLANERNTAFIIDELGQPHYCGEINCTNCQFADAYDCNAARLEWLLSEYVERTINHNDVAIDTKVYVSDEKEPTFDPDKCRRAHYAGWDADFSWPEVFRNGRTQFTNKDRLPIAYSNAWLPDGTRIV